MTWPALSARPYGAGGGALVDLDARAGLGLQPLDGFAAAADHAAHHLFRALDDLLRLPGAHGARANGAALDVEAKGEVGSQT